MSLISLFLNGGRYGDVQVLKPETVAAIETMQTSTNGSPLRLDDLGVVVMGSVEGYQPASIAEGLVGAWKHQK